MDPQKQSKSESVLSSTTSIPDSPNPIDRLCGDYTESFYRGRVPSGGLDFLLDRTRLTKDGEIIELDIQSSVTLGLNELAVREGNFQFFSMHQPVSKTASSALWHRVPNMYFARKSRSPEQIDAYFLKSQEARLRISDVADGELPWTDLVLAISLQYHSETFSDGKVYTEPTQAPAILYMDPISTYLMWKDKDSGFEEGGVFERETIRHAEYKTAGEVLASLSWVYDYGSEQYAYDVAEEDFRVAPFCKFMAMAVKAEEEQVNEEKRQQRAMRRRKR